MGIGKDKLILDTSNLTESDNVGAYLRASDGTLLTHTDVGGKKSLDVNVANSITVTSTDLDIRDLSHTQDSVKVGDGTDFMAVNADGSINVTFPAGSEIKITDGTDDLAINADGSINSVVTATDLDIRNLSHTQDSVKIGDGTDFLAINADGSINVNADISVVNGAEKAEDAAHVSGDIGQFVLGVRDDVLSASTSADGDYAALKSDKFGRMWVNEAHQAQQLASTTVGTSAVQLASTPLSGRKRMLIQNLGSKAIYVGPTGVLTTTGLRIASNANAEFMFEENCPIYAISTAAGQDVRVMELA